MDLTDKEVNKKIAELVKQLNNITFCSYDDNGNEQQEAKFNIKNVSPEIRISHNGIIINYGKQRNQQSRRSLINANKL